MKLVILIMYFFSIATFNVLAQEVVSQRSEIEKYAKSQYLWRVFSHKGDGLYAINIRQRRYGSDIWTMEYFDDQLTKKSSNELSITFEEKPFYPEFVLSTKTRLLLFSTLKESKKKKSAMIVQSINQESHLPNQDIQKIVEIEYDNANFFQKSVSKDSSKILIYTQSSNKLSLTVLNENAEKQWGKIILPQRGITEGSQIDNKGNVYLLRKIFMNEKEQKGIPNYTYSVFSYDNGGEGEKEYKVDIEGKFLSNMSIVIYNNEQIICSGFYSNKGKRTVKGIYFMAIDIKTKKVVKSSFKEFDASFITSTSSKIDKIKTKGKEDPELYSYDIQDIILREDGGTILVGEQYYDRSSSWQTTYYTPSGRVLDTDVSSSDFYYNNDIIVISINPNGDIDWAKNIPKKQIAANEISSISYAVKVISDKLYFMYNDNKNNLNIKGSDKVQPFNASGMSRKNGTFTLVEIDSNGNATQRSLFDYKGLNDIYIYTADKVSLFENEVVFFARASINTASAKHKTQFIKIRLDN